MEYVLVEFSDNSMAVLESASALNKFNAADPPKVGDCVIAYYSKYGSKNARPYTSTILHYGGT